MYGSYEEISRAANDPSFQRFGDSNPLRKGLKLHASKISLTNPENGELVSFSSPPAEGFSRLLAYAGLTLP